MRRLLFIRCNSASITFIMRGNDTDCAVRRSPRKSPGATRPLEEVSTRLSPRRRTAVLARPREDQRYADPRTKTGPAWSGTSESGAMVTSGASAQRDAGDVLGAVRRLPGHPPTRRQPDADFPPPGSGQALAVRRPDRTALAGGDPRPRSRLPGQSRAGMAVAVDSIEVAPCWPFPPMAGTGPQHPGVGAPRHGCVNIRPRALGPGARPGQPGDLPRSGLAKLGRGLLKC
jgi:hypothetical protein